MFRFLYHSLFAGFVLFLIPITALADQSENWPREIETEHGILTIYQPQPEKLVSNILQGRAAASLLDKASTEPTFGVFWFTARIDTDRDTGTSLIRNITVTQTRWPDSNEEDERKVASWLTELMPKTDIPISLERLKESLLTAESERRSLEGLRHDPPKIITIEELAVLLQFDGEPRAIPIPDSDLEHIANAPFAVIRDKKSGLCYLSGGDFWYRAQDPMGPWDPISQPPAEITKLVPPDESSPPELPKAPKIVVATEPTELIATDGPPAWKPIGKGELLYIGNTETPVVREVATGKVFLLVSGRWFTAASLSGPWNIVRPDETPASFKNIPPDSDLGSVRVSVADTPEAEDAMLDAQLPQTAAIDREKATLKVEYDGKPQFKSISGTEVEYATNTSAQVLRIDSKYYACDNGIWFLSDKSDGPWTVADSVPMEKIKKIPPSEPVYNVTYVTIYESTPKVVYVGYTPGYMWSYPWYGCPVYGTGWYYPPYWGPVYYYPRPATFGMSVRYNPWTGWSFGVSYSSGFMYVGVRFGGGYGGYYRPGYPPRYYRPPYYPPGGYRPPYRPPGYRPGRPPPRPTPYAGRPAQLPANSNIYQRPETRDRVAPATMQQDVARQKADRVANTPNNVFGDRNGNVHRQTQQGWESRNNGQWKPSQPSTRPAQPSSPSVRPSQPSTRPAQPSSPSVRPSQPSTRPSQPSVRPSQPPAGLNRDVRGRQQGSSRSRPAPQPGGGARRR